jgi:hypothetical protein
MTQTRLGALSALEAPIKVDLEGAGIAFFRNPATSVDASRAGVVIMSDGIPGEPEVLLSPRRYCWDHQVEFEITAKGDDRKTVVEDIIKRFDPVLDLDRTLGGAVDYAAIESAPDGSDYEVEGAETEYSAVLRVTLAYVTASGAG